MKAPILPMLAKRVAELPEKGAWIYEPKWDGFRALIFRDQDEILIQSRDQKSLNRYFPELIDPLLQQLPERCVLDGEVVIARNGALDFDGGNIFAARNDDLLLAVDDVQVAVLIPHSHVAGVEDRKSVV